MNPPVDHLRQLIEEHGAVLFMKGTPEYPMCGYSDQAVRALNQVQARNVHYVNVLEDALVRANLPRYSNWPTYPQFFLSGELVGGADILLELLDSGELQRIAADLDQQAA